MTILCLFDESRKEVLRTDNRDELTKVLRENGIAFESVSVQNLSQESKENTLGAYEGFINKVKAERGFQSVDVVRITADMDNVAAMRGKFLNEHIHAEDEARFFTSGSGAFYINLGSNVAMLVCEAGDFVSVPAGTKHWFDMSSNPNFTAIRFFTNPEGWVAQFTGSDIASTIPEFRPWSAPF